MNSASWSLNSAVAVYVTMYIYLPLDVIPTHTQDSNMINTVPADVPAADNCGRHSADYILAQQDFLQGILYHW